MRTQASFARWLASFVQPAFAVGALPELVPAVVPVAVVAVDHADDSRSTFSIAADLAAAGAQHGRVVLSTALNAPGATRLQALGISGGSAALNFEVLVGRWEQLTAITPSGPSDVRATGPGQSRMFVETGLSGVAGSPVLETTPNLTLWVPVEGIVLEPGYSVRIQSATPNQVFRVWASWRNA